MSRLVLTYPCIIFFVLCVEYVARYATKEAADAAADESSSDDDMSSIESFSDDDEAAGLEL